jgi:preprotein translocase subunit YajC
MNLYAQAQEGAAAQQQSPYSMLIMFGLIAVIFYFFLIRPQKKKQQQHQTLVNNIKSGAKIITAGGIYGTVTRVIEDRFEIQIDKNTKMQISKSSVSSILDAEKDTDKVKK